ncbi:MAG TPA: OsmC family protein, partial [Gemmatimonadaceae bacterium]|nr:OsmC family protein [Gemmatimonadaceae bacterium]
DTGPTPYDFLLFAIASCTAITLRMYANRKGWPVGDILVDVRRTRSHEVDAEWSDRAKVGLYTVEERIDFRGPVSVEQRARLMTIADRCPVKRTLENGVRVVRPGRDGGGIGT